METREVEEMMEKEGLMETIEVTGNDREKRVDRDKRGERK